MNKILTMVLCLYSVSTAQEITFEKNYYLYPGHYVYETNNGSFIISAIDDSKKKAQTIFTDSSGEVKWIREFEVTTYCVPQAIGTYDDGIVILSTQTGVVRLSKLNQNSSVVWEKEFQFEGSAYGVSVLQTDEKSLIISGFHTKPNKIRYIFVTKTDADGNILWQKDYVFSPASYSLAYPALGIKTKENTIYIRANHLIYILTADGDSVKQINTGSFMTSLEKLNEGFLVTGDKYISKIDESGNIIWKKWVQGKINSMCGTDDNNFVITQPASILKISTDADTIWNTDCTLTPYFISKTRSGGFITTGKRNTGLGLLKTRSNGFTASMLIYSPKKGEVLSGGSNYKVWIYKKNVDKISLDFSSDNGRSWSLNEVITNAQIFYWSVPFVNSDSCMIRLNDAGNSTPSVLSEQFSVKYFSGHDTIEVNNIKMWISSDGITSHNPFSDAAGLFWPKGIKNGYGYEISAVFSDGLIWGGKVDGVLHVNGATYRTGLQPSDTVSGIWKLRSDWESTTGSLRNKYSYNYYNWPGEKGAPFIDVNKDSKYSRETDLPDICGDEVLWFSANDLDTAKSRRLYGTDPIGIEMQSTHYAYNRGDDLDDVIFKKYKIINKSSKEIKDMFLAYWSDADLGESYDDFTGCDTLLDLGFIYNGDNSDQGYYGDNPPAIGYKILQGPAVPGLISDTAYFNGRKVCGRKNLHLYAYHPILKGTVWADATLGSPEGAKQIYYQMQGKIWDGLDVVNPVTCKVTRFALSGDPVAHIGWYEGAGWPGGDWPGERRFIISAGPFELAPADTQEIVFAVIMARGIDNIHSVAELKRKARVVQKFYDKEMTTGVDGADNTPDKYALAQNYPNPFNPLTTIRYSLAEKSFVEINVYDILGKKVMTLVNEERPAGEYQVYFNANNLSSGVYYYQMKTRDYVSTKKMILIK